MDQWVELEAGGSGRARGQGEELQNEAWPDDGFEFVQFCLVYLQRPQCHVTPPVKPTDEEIH